MEDWINFILMIVSGLVFVGSTVLYFLCPDVFATFPTPIKWSIFLNDFCLSYFLLVETFVRRY